MKPNVEEQREKLRRGIAEIASSNLADAFATVLVDLFAAGMTSAVIAEIRKKLRLVGVDEATAASILAAAEKLLAERSKAGAHEGIRQTQEQQAAARRSSVIPLRVAFSDTVH